MTSLEVSKRMIKPINTVPKPFLKWAGGKRRLAKIIIKLIPKEFFSSQGGFYEPFVGGGAVTFSLGEEKHQSYIPGDRLIINDINKDLVTTYTAIRDNLDELITRLNLLEKYISKESFYEIRAKQPDNNIDLAARMIYLNKTCFNGLWRVNSKGQFNVPWGNYKNPVLYEIENLLACHKRIQNAKILNLDFAQAVTYAKIGDFVYFDPPYIPLSSTSSFSQYAKANFGQKEHLVLKKVVDDLTQKGIKVILSNSDTELTREIFGSNMNLYKINVQRSISASRDSRIVVSEIIACNYKLKLESIDQKIIAIKL